MNIGLGTYSLKTRIVGHYTLTYLVMDVNMDVAVSVSVINPRVEAAGGRNSGRELRST